MIVLLVAFSFIYFLKATNTTEKLTKNNSVVDDCIALCMNEKNKGRDLSNGPCLSDGNPLWRHVDWVCDVAHNPRIPADNLPENQCKDYREGKAHHFVEVDPNCKYIREY